MANYRWEFNAVGAADAVKMAAALTRLDRILLELVHINQQLAAGNAAFDAAMRRTSGTVNQSTTIINHFNTSTRGATTHVKSLFERLTSAAHVWNVWNAAINFGTQRLQQMRGAIGDVLQVGMGFESQTATLKGLLDNYQPVIDKAKELGRATKYSAEESAAGAVELAKAGLSSQEIIGSLPATLQAAEANTISVAQAAKIAAVGMNQFKRSGEDGTKILQIYTAAANASSTDILPLSAAMKNAAGAASLLGLDAAKTATFMSMMGSKGIEAGAAGTQLKIALMNLSSITPRAAASLQKLGINAKSLNLADPVSWLNLFSERLKALPSDAERIAAIKPIMGEAVTGMLPILMEGGAAFQQMFDQITSTTGKMAEMQQAQAATIGGAWEGMKSAMEGVLLGIYDILRTPILSWFQTWQGVLSEVGARLNDVAQKFLDSKMTVQEWIATMKSGGFSGLFDDLLLDLEPQINALKTLAAAAWETVKSLIKEGLKSIFTSDVKEMLKTQGLSIAEAVFDEISKLPQIAAVMDAMNAGKSVMTKTDDVIELGKITVTKGAIPYIMENNRVWEQQAAGMLAGLGELERKKRAIEAIPLVDRSEQDAKRLRTINAAIGVTEKEISKLADEYRAAGREDLIKSNPLFASVVARNTATPNEATPVSAIAPMSYQERKAIKINAFEIQSGQRYQAQTIEKIQEAGQAPYKGKMPSAEAAEMRIQQFIRKGFSEKQARYVVGEQRAKTKAASDAAEKQAKADAFAQAQQDAEMRRKLQEEQAQQALAQEQEITKEALKQLDIERQKWEERKKYNETQAAVANVGIDLQMKQNTTDSGFSKWLLEPINKFREAISGVIGKFMGVFEGLGKQRTEAGLKSGRLTEEGAKKESAQVLEGSVTRAQKMLKLAQTPGQKAEAMQTEAEKLMQISELTGDKSKAKQADDLLERAQSEQGKQEDIEIRKVELDRKLAKDNMKLLEGKQDGSASEAATRLKQLMESAMELGDVGKASQFKAQLQDAERKAAGEQVGVLKQILQELQLSRKSNDLAMTEQTDAMKQGTAQQVDKLTAIQNNSGGYDPAYATP